MKRLIFCLSGNPHRNSRALRQTQSLAAEFAITALGFGPRQPRPDFRHEPIATPSGTGPIYFWRLHKIFMSKLGERDADLLHASDLYALPAVARRAQTLGTPYTYDARELYPNVAAISRSPAKRLFWKTIEQRYIRNTSLVITVSDSIAALLTERYNISRPLVIPNTPTWQSPDISSYLRTWAGIPEDQTIILHQGQMRENRGCEQLLEALCILNNAHVVFLGNGPTKPALQQQARKLNIDRLVHFHDAVAPDQLLDITASADIGVTLLQDTCLNHRYALPNKLFEYIMAGIPVCGSNLPEISRVILDHNVGLTTNINNTNELAQTLQYMIDHPDQRSVWSENARVAAETLNWSTASQVFLKSFVSLV